MSKALVIKGANFALNKVETITLSQVVPCTGITVSPTTVALETIGATQQITPTLTPVDTTDTVYYVSSDTDVATVSTSGLITSVGVGSATITVTCGEQSATVAVTSTHTVILDDVYHAENGQRYSGSISLPTKDYIGLVGATYGRVYYSTDVYGEYRAFVETENVGKYCIPIPQGTSAIAITPPEGLRSWTRIAIANVHAKQTYISGDSGNAVKAVGYFEAYNVDISGISNANGLIVSIQGSSSTDASAITGKTTVTFS